MGGLRRVQMGRLVVWVVLQKLITFLGGWVGAEMVSSIVMYNFGGGPRGDPMNLAF